MVQTDQLHLVYRLLLAPAQLQEDKKGQHPTQAVRAMQDQRLLCLHLSPPQHPGSRCHIEPMGLCFEWTESTLPDCVNVIDAVP